MYFTKTAVQHWALINRQAAENAKIVKNNIETLVLNWIKTKLRSRTSTIIHTTLLNAHCSQTLLHIHTHKASYTQVFPIKQQKKNKLFLHIKLGNVYYYRCFWRNVSFGSWGTQHPPPLFFFLNIIGGFILLYMLILV